MAEAPATEIRGRKPGSSGLGEALSSLVAILVALAFLFPLYWAFSTSLRNPIDTFTVAGFGILVTSTTIPFRQFGFVTAYTILLAMLAAVLVLPSALVLWSRWHSNRS